MLAPIWQWILVPAAVAGVVLGLGWRVWSREAPPVWGGRWVVPLAFAAGFVVGYILLEGTQGIFAPKTAEQRLPALAGVALVVAIIYAVLKPRFESTPDAWLFVYAFAEIFLRPPGMDDWKITVAFVAASLLAQWPLSYVAKRRPGASMPMVYWVQASGVLMAQALSGAISYAQFTGPLAAAAGAAAVLAWLKPSVSYGGGASGTFVTLLGALVLLGNLLSELPFSVALILASAPMFLLIGEMGWVTRRKAWQQVVVRAACVGVPVGVAVLVAAVMSPPVNGY